jgi:hypothetical protein
MSCLTVSRALSAPALLLFLVLDYVAVQLVCKLFLITIWHFRFVLRASPTRGSELARRVRAPPTVVEIAGPGPNPSNVAEREYENCSR